MITYKILSQETLLKTSLSSKVFKDLSQRIPFSKTIFDHNPNTMLILAMDGDKIIGISNFGIYGYDRKYWALSYISIDAQYRGRGISKDLIRYTVIYLKNKGIKDFSLSTLESDGIRAKLAENFYNECKKYGIELHLSDRDKEKENKLKMIANKIRETADDAISKLRFYLMNIPQKGNADFGSFAFHQLINDPDCEFILSHGKIYNRRPVFIKGVEAECHWNVANLYKQKKIDAIVIGYAQNIKNGWHQHTWGLKGNNVIETTESNKNDVLRFGAILSGSKLSQFIKMCKKYGPGEGMIRTQQGVDEDKTLQEIFDEQHKLQNSEEWYKE